MKLKNQVKNTNIKENKRNKQKEKTQENKNLFDFIQSSLLPEVWKDMFQKNLKIDNQTRHELECLISKLIYNYNKIDLEKIFRNYCPLDF